MIIKIPKDRGVFPHMGNILGIHSKNSALNLLEEYDPMFAGGYPMSLLLAPREASNHLKIKPGYFSDYDVYFRTAQNYKEANDKLLNDSNFEVMIETENAITHLSKEIDTQLKNKTQILPTFPEPYDTSRTLVLLNLPIVIGFW